jgi:hypothetical protein
MLTRFYTPMVIISLASCIYAYFKPGIISPSFPNVEMKKALTTVNSATLLSETKTPLDKDTNDRKLSPLFTYSYNDGSKILAVIARVSKKDDFKIETYGLLTKNIEPIYLKNSSFINSIPHSIIGMLGKTKSIQTCIIPKTTRIEESDIRLSALNSTLEKLNPRSNSLSDKILGNKKHIDYSCLVLTYIPQQSHQKIPTENWIVIVKNVQRALLSQAEANKSTN